MHLIPNFISKLLMENSFVTEFLLQWFRQNKRNLPWREDKNPYYIWLSEVILQQTRVAQGLPYFEKFKENFPTIVDLANASEDQVLKLWQGLGYYSRARNMHAAAKMVAAKKGIFPNTFQEILTLKGVGEYTAAAIASIAFNEKTAVVDGNVYRVISRLFDIDIPIDSNEGKKVFKKLANDLISEKFPGDYNQAIMEFGALFCTPQNPNCESCGLKFNCMAFQAKTVDVRPVKEKKVKTKNRYFYYLDFIDKNHNRVLVQRIKNDIWKGLFELPLIETLEEIDEISLVKIINENFNLEIQKLPFFVEKRKHILTHQRIYTSFYQVQIDSLTTLKMDGFKIVKVEETKNFAVPRLIDLYLQNNFKS